MSSSRGSPPPKVVRSDIDESLPAARSRLCSNRPATDLQKCIICQDSKRGLKNRRLKEELNRCTWDGTHGTLMNAAHVRGDERLLELEGVDLPAKGILYHPSCYKDYTSPKALGRLGKQAYLKEEVDDRPQERAFSRLVKEVEETVLADNSTVTDLSQLRAKYNGFLHEELGGEAEACRGDVLKARLREHFGDKLSFHRPHRRNQAQFVFSSNVNPGPLIEQCMKMTAREEERLSEGEDLSVEDMLDTSTISEDVFLDLDAAQTVYCAASILRQKLMDVKNSMPYPPTPNDLSEENIPIPAAVYNFLLWLFSGISPKHDGGIDEINLNVRGQPSSPEVHRKVLSIGQDLVYCVSHGRVKTPKHVALSVAVKQMTGSSKVVDLLNHFGHGVSGSQLSEIDTAMAERVIEEQQGQPGFLPSNITAPTFVTLCWDNNDLREDSLSGKTTHCTNGIVIQRKVQSCALPPSMRAESRTPRRRKRSLDSPLQVIVEYNAGKREGPRAITLPAGSVELASSTRGIGETDFMWLLARLLSSDSAALGQAECNQKTPSWTAFNAMISRDAVTRPSAVGYLPVLASSPTELSTVYQLLQRSISVCDQLHQDDVVVVVDQAVYAKAAEIVWKHQSTFSRIVLRMGGFHIAMTFLAVLGKRFGDAGLHDILVESGIVGTSAVHGVLSGKHYN